MTNSRRDAPPGGQPPRVSSVPAYSQTTGDEAIELGRAGGIYLDLWQQIVLRDLLGERPDGSWAAFETGLVCPRQNGKNEILLVRELAGLFLLDERLIVHSAHEFPTSLEHFQRLVAVIESSDDLRSQVKPRGIKQSHGSEGIELLDGSRIRFKARHKGSLRGFTADCLIFDEAWNLSETAHGAILPTLSTRPNPQIIYAGTAVDQWFHENGIVLARIRERGIAGEDPSLAYFEWSIEGDSPDAITDEIATDPEVWRQANPALGIRIDEEYVSREQATLGPRQFAVERLGVGDWPNLDEADQVISAESWKALRDAYSQIVGPVCVAWDVTPDRRAAAVGVAGRREDGLFHTEVIEHKSGTGWLPELIAAIEAKQDVGQTRCDSIGPAGSMVPAVNELLDDEVDELSTRDYARACGRFYDAVEDGLLRHLGTPELTAAVASATKRPLGDSWAWARSGGDISPLVACTIALDGAMNPVAAPEPFMEVF